MSQTVDKIILFTLAACPTGRNMGTILREVGEKYPSIKLKTVYVEIDIEMTNHYRIKTNPTLLFLNREDKELFRLEGFHETEEINDIIREINQNKRSSTQTREPNKGTTENYTIFLLKSGKPTAVKVQHYNETSIKAPRITIINILLGADVKAYENPFPKDSKLDSVEFNRSLAKITIKTKTDPSIVNIKQMETLLLKTLESFDIHKINLSFL